VIPNVDWKTTFEAEIRRAEEARLSGNEGMARVCARRAAGVLIGEYIKRHGTSLVAGKESGSSYDRLRYLSELPEVSPQVAHTADHLLQRVTIEHTLMEEVDLIAETRWLRQELLGE
jgi:hypothetical protein